MGRIAAIGERLRIEGLALGGVLVRPAGDPGEVAAAWAALGPEVAVLILTSDAAKGLEERLPERPQLLVAVLP